MLMGTPPASITLDAGQFTIIDDFDCDGGCLFAYPLGIAIDSRDTVYVSGAIVGLDAGDTTARSGFVRALTIDAGSWSTIDSFAVQVINEWPRITVDGCDNLFVTAQVAASGGWAIRRRLATQGSFSEVKRNFTGGAEWANNIAVAPDGGLFCSGTFGNNQSVVFSVDHGSTWATALNRNEGVAYHVPSKTVVSPRGSVMIPGYRPTNVWTEFSNADGGFSYQTFGTGVGRGGAASPFGPLYMSGDTGGLAVVKRSTDDGSTWNDVFSASASGNCSGGEMTATRSGVFATYQCGVTGSGYLAASPNGVLGTWTNLLTTFSYAPGKIAALGAMATDSQGRLYVTAWGEEASGSRRRWLVLRFP